MLKIVFKPKPSESKSRVPPSTCESLDFPTLTSKASSLGGWMDIFTMSQSPAPPSHSTREGPASVYLTSSSTCDPGLPSYLPEISQSPALVV